ncbi:MAG: hypothetical protein IKT70_08635 [Clostridia bacterium]|nr:hypothetical protein [Clostridia bacterium]
MASYFIEVLLNTPTGSTLEDPSVLCDDVTDLINSQPENNVIYYCSWLNEAVVNYGGLAQNPNVYKQEYLRRLRICIQNSYKNISNNTPEIEKMLIPGIKEYFYSL